VKGSFLYESHYLVGIFPDTVQFAQEPLGQRSGADDKDFPDIVPGPVQEGELAHEDLFPLIKQTDTHPNTADGHDREDGIGENDGTRKPNEMVSDRDVGEKEQRSGKGGLEDIDQIVHSGITPHAPIKIKKIETHHLAYDQKKENLHVKPPGNLIDVPFETEPVGTAITEHEKDDIDRNDQ